MSPTDRFNAFLAGVLPGTENIGRNQRLSWLRRTGVKSYKNQFRTIGLPRLIGNQVISRMATGSNELMKQFTSDL